MADIQHKNITDPNLHEPKGVKFADANTVYIADGEGSGSWGTVLFPSDIASTRYQVLKFSGSNSSAINNVLYPLTYTEEEIVGDAIVTFSNNAVTFSESGVYCVEYILSMSLQQPQNDWHNDANYAYGYLKLTSSSSTYTEVSKMFLPYYAASYSSGDDDPNPPPDVKVVNQRNILFMSAEAGSKLGLWATGQYTYDGHKTGYGMWKANVSGYVQIVKV